MSLQGEGALTKPLPSWQSGISRSSDLVDLVIYKKKKTSSIMMDHHHYHIPHQAPAADPGHNQPRQFSTGFNFGRFVQK